MDTSPQDPPLIETRPLGDGSALARDRDGNMLSATGGDAAVVLVCAQHVARLPPDDASGWWRGEPQTGGIAVSRNGDVVELVANSTRVHVAVDVWQWAIIAAYAEHLGDFTRWLFDARPRACIAGDGDREAVVPLETSATQFAADVAANALAPEVESARRRSLLAQASAFALFSEPMLTAKRDALLAFECPTLARWADGALALAAYYASADRARISPSKLGPADVLGGVLSLDFPSAAPPPGEVPLHRWWAFCENELVEASRGGMAEHGFMISRSGSISAKLYFRNEDGTRCALYAVSGSKR